MKEKLILLLISLTVTVAFAEVALRVVGFSYRLYPEKIEFGFPDPKRMSSLYQPDSERFWVTKDYFEKVDQFIKSPPTVLLMGDSCTQFGKYDEYLQTKTNSLQPDKKITIGKLGVGGWGSYQGSQQMKLDVTRIKPKVATIYYGWNDHWMGFGMHDKDIARLHSPLMEVFERLRFAQLAVKAFIVMSQGKDESIPIRVELPDFKENLTYIVNTARSIGTTPMLLTAPSSHQKGKEPQYLKQRFIKDLTQLIPLHQSYVNAVRELAASSHTPLCDLEKSFKELPADTVSKTYFTSDGIHLTPEGNEVLAGFLYDCLTQQNLI
jgi:lysophospholipase L1-like esterase